MLSIGHTNTLNLLLLILLFSIYTTVSEHVMLVTIVILVLLPILLLSLAHLIRWLILGHKLELVRVLQGIQLALFFKRVSDCWVCWIFRFHFIFLIICHFDTYFLSLLHLCNSNFANSFYLFTFKEDGVIFCVTRQWVVKDVFGDATVLIVSGCLGCSSNFIPWLSLQIDASVIIKVMYFAFLFFLFRVIKDCFRDALIASINDFYFGNRIICRQWHSLQRRIIQVCIDAMLTWIIHIIIITWRHGIQYLLLFSLLGLRSLTFAAATAFFATLLVFVILITWGV